MSSGFKVQGLRYAFCRYMHNLYMLYIGFWCSGFRAIFPHGRYIPLIYFVHDICFDGLGFRAIVNSHGSYITFIWYGVWGALGLKFRDIVPHCPHIPFMYPLYGMGSAAV